MAQLISEIWEGLRDAGLPEVMLYLADQSASRCHWKDTTMIGEVRVALLADQDRQIVRILPVDSCVGIGIASPKGVDPSGYKTVVYKKLAVRFGGELPVEAVEEPLQADHHAHAPVATTPPAPAPAPAPEPEPPAAPPDPLTSRWACRPVRPSAVRRTPGTAVSGSFGAIRRPGP
ncbi:MAG: hypothetical protein U0794_20365 [Isosphaeraceae bacterium]